MEIIHVFIHGLMLLHDLLVLIDLTAVFSEIETVTNRYEGQLKISTMGDECFRMSFFSDLNTPSSSYQNWFVLTIVLPNLENPPPIRFEKFNIL